MAGNHITGIHRQGPDPAADADRVAQARGGDAAGELLDGGDLADPVVGPGARQPGPQAGQQLVLRPVRQGEHRLARGRDPRLLGRSQPRRSGSASANGIQAVARDHDQIGLLAALRGRRGVRARSSPRPSGNPTPRRPSSPACCTTSGALVMETRDRPGPSYAAGHVTERERHRRRGGRGLRDQPRQGGSDPAAALAPPGIAVPQHPLPPPCGRLPLRHHQAHGLRRRRRPVRRGARRAQRAHDARPRACSTSRVPGPVPATDRGVLLDPDRTRDRRYLRLPLARRRRRHPRPRPPRDKGRRVVVLGGNAERTGWILGLLQSRRDSSWCR